MQAAEWDGVVNRSDWQAEVLSDRDRLADAAKAGQWPEMFAVLAQHPWVNRARPGGGSCFAPLHQAAWHGADPAVIHGLLDLGAWRTLRAGDGRRAVDIAEQRGHHRLVEILRPVPVHPVPDAVLDGLREHLHLLIHGRIPRLTTEHELRLPQVAPLTELAPPALWFPVPGLYGGFSIALSGEELTVKSWNRVQGGWARTHLVTADGIRLLESGWDA
jgi:hypothetical protein